MYYILSLSNQTVTHNTAFSYDTIVISRSQGWSRDGYFTKVYKKWSKLYIQVKKDIN